MDRSKLSHIICTTRLLPYFSETNVDTIKQCIFDQLMIQTESQFLCIVLNSLYKTLSRDSLSAIRTKAIEIAENQLIKDTTSITNTITQSNANARSQQQGNMTVYKYIQKQHGTGLCQLHSDIIDYFGTFLSKKQSIEFGYLNKQLYIETQKQSYLLKRCNDDVFTFDSNKYSKMLIGKNDVFNYTFPRSLRLLLNYHHSTMFPKTSYFSNFFRRLSILNCSSFSSLYGVPLKYVFIKHRNSYLSNESGDDIDVFQLLGYLTTHEMLQAVIEQVDIVCKNFDRLILEESNSRDKIRGIKQFKFELFLVSDSRKYIDCMNLLGKRMILRFGSISKSIHLSKTKLTFERISEVKSVFHPDLRHLYFDYSAPIIINFDVKNIENHVASLERITFNTSMFGSREDNPSCIDTLNELDKVGIRQNIKLYTLEWNPRYTSSDNLGYILTLDIGRDVHVFDKIFFQDYDKHPLLESITVEFMDDDYLFGLARLLIYISQHYKQLFVQRKLYLRHFETIEIDLVGIWVSADQLQPVHVQRYPHQTNNPEFFQQNRNEEYSIDDKRIEIKSSQLKEGIESFGIIFQNIFYWLQRMKQKSCNIVFRIE